MRSSAQPGRKKTRKKTEKKRNEKARRTQCESTFMLVLPRGI
jgi:hypothetical protein